MKEPLQTTEGHAKRITKLVLFGYAYGGNHEAVAKRIQEYLDRNFKVRARYCTACGTHLTAVGTHIGHGPCSGR